ncbi:hypothetical protein LCGC14_1705320 [marine sediment metagenome]|uniref:Uncharacterized protein n=1 Tax=marine sediment metagenome TaxID=412755 RepID=A0A0F9KGX8_9ZZZZ|nr:hypothetical protein [Desulfobacterales bacterium]
MGEQRNLTEENVDELKVKLDKMQETNPELEYRFYEQDEKESLECMEQPSNKKIFEKREAIERQLNLIFDGHVLIDGRFRKIRPMGENT